jgi:hypothetical protein
MEGLVTSAVKRGVSLLKIWDQTRHKSVEMLRFKLPQARCVSAAKQTTRNICQFGKDSHLPPFKAKRQNCVRTCSFTPAPSRGR